MTNFLKGNRGAVNTSFITILVVIIAIIVVVGFLSLSPFNNGERLATETGFVGGENVDMVDGYELTDEEKEEIIQAVLRTDSVIRSGDVEMIRDHISNVDASGISQLGDEEILELVQFYIEFNGEISAEDFYSNELHWQVDETGTRAMIWFEKDGEPRIFEAAKVDGVWY